MSACDVPYVTFERADADVHAAIDAAYHAKYDRYGQRIDGSVTAPYNSRTPTRSSPSHAARASISASTASAISGP